MKAARIHNFGGPEVIVLEDIPRSIPATGEILVRVAAAGVGPWDALIREGKSDVAPPPPLTLGSDLSGVVEETGPGVTQFIKGDEVYGVTNFGFVGAQAEYAVASAATVAHKPPRLSNVEAASAPVVAVTAWQMLHDYAHVQARQTVLILGAAGNVGAYAVQLAANAGLHIVALVGPKDFEYVRGLGAETVIDYHGGTFESSVSPVDVVIDTVGGNTRDRSLQVLKAGGILVSVVSPTSLPSNSNVRTAFFYVEVTTDRLNTISKLFDSRKLLPQVGTVLPLSQVRTAHEMLAGKPHRRGKIVLQVSTS
jgi:NADPH:quinone reductase-like Zn-dependent oxidoreductase